MHYSNGILQDWLQETDLAFQNTKIAQQIFCCSRGLAFYGIQKGNINLSLKVVLQMAWNY